jgi:prophage antirepressor-like protein
MEALAKHYNVGKEEDLYCLDDIASNIIKTNRKSLYMSKIKERHKINGKYYVTEPIFKNILKNARSETGQKAYEMYFQFVDIPKHETTQKPTTDTITDETKIENHNQILQTNTSENKIINTNIQSKFIDYENSTIHVIVLSFYECWFRGIDICKILGYSKERDALHNILDEENINTLKNILNNSRTANNTGGHDSFNIKKLNENSLYIDYTGLYELCILSKKPNAKPFRKWICKEVIPSIVKTGSYSLKEYEEVPLQLPLLPHNIDINDYINKSCIYFIHIKQNLYKVGWTHKILDRFSDHKKNYDYQSVIKVYQLENNNDCSEIEGKIKRYLKENNILANHQTLKKIIRPDMKNSTEIFEVTDKFTLQHILNITQHYLSDLKEEKKKQQIINGQSFVADDMLSNPNIPKEVLLKRLEIEAESRKHDFELHKLQLQLQIELAKSGQISQIQSNLQFSKQNMLSNNIANTETLNYEYSNDDLQIEVLNSPAEKTPIHVLPFNIYNQSPKKQDQNDPIDLSEIDEYFEEINIEQPIKSPKPKQTEKKPIKKTTKSKPIQTPPKVEVPRSKFAIIQNIQKPKKPQKEIQRLEKCCSVCNHPLTAFRNRCDYCPNLKKLQDAVERGGRPSFLTLKKDLETMSMVAVGKKYGVSDNCIKKWLNKYVKYGLTNN